MTEREPATKPASTEAWVDPDDAPELDDDFFERADEYVGETLVRRGRPKSDAPKRQVTIRLDEDVLDRLRATGPGWQTRLNAILRDWMKRDAA
ncbi:BrnA antitoxin family protein [Hansschlegelia plantiphila]|uniref:BrnA antitoxin family protein n=1 Tax=Hansschlegelia plantiphila TaxID=374655 RepID=A0A9W6IZ77_9HYPH|nr:BrnA antitoxin family protein [Hansschlegelia plantiphila]GLK67387.1 hypothetical protein GCM10008179_10250 [Hansschlegelia plantiphila]